MLGFLLKFMITIEGSKIISADVSESCSFMKLVLTSNLSCSML